MAFLASATSAFSSSFISSSFPSKPAQIHGKVKRTQRFKVSCKGSQGDETRNPSPESDETSLGTLERRNMLLGLGGLYGAANIMAGGRVALADSNRTGDPIPYPDPSQCKDARVPEPQFGKPCPTKPFEPDSVKQYEFPSQKEKRVRPAAHLVDDKYIEKYMNAIQEMKKLCKDDPNNPLGFYQQANIHTAYCNYGYPTGATAKVGEKDEEILLQVHKSWLFLPFHRWYLYFFEKIAGKLIDDPTFALPYWNWDAPCGMTMPYMFTTKMSPLDHSKENPLFNPNRNEDHLPPAVIDFSNPDNGNTPSIQLPDIQKVCNNLAIMYRQMAPKDPAHFMGKPLYFDSQPNPGDGTLESSPHGPVHAWTGRRKDDKGGDGSLRGIGEDMGHFYSAGKDPLFYCHHANVDRLWTIWLSLGHGRRNFKHRAWLGTQFFFFDENGKPVFVTVEQCLHNEKDLGYTYQPMEMPWRMAKPLPKRPKSGIAKTIAAPKVIDAFPATLDKAVKVVVQRSQKNRTEKEKEEEEEILVIEGIKLPRDQFVNVVVLINDDDLEGRVLNKAEFLGTFTNVPQGSPHADHDSSHHDDSDGNTITTSKTFPLNEILEDLQAEDDESILVTLIPQGGGDNVAIQRIKIDFAEKNAA